MENEHMNDNNYPIRLDGIRCVFRNFYSYCAVFPSGVDVKKNSLVAFVRNDLRAKMSVARTMAGLLFSLVHSNNVRNCVKLLRLATARAVACQVSFMRPSQPLWQRMSCRCCY